MGQSAGQVGTGNDGLTDNKGNRGSKVRMNGPSKDQLQRNRVGSVTMEPNSGRDEDNVRKAPNDGRLNAG